MRLENASVTALRDRSARTSGFLAAIVFRSFSDIRSLVSGNKTSRVAKLFRRFNHTKPLMSLTTPLSQDQAAHRARVAGVLMLSSAVLSVLMMAHHPSVHSRDAHEVVSSITSQAAAAQWVHG